MSGRVGTIHSPSEKRYGRTLYAESRSMRCTIDPVGTARDDHRPGSSEITGQFCRDVFAVAAGCSRPDDRHKCALLHLMQIPARFLLSVIVPDALRRPSVAGVELRGGR